MNLELEKEQIIQRIKHVEEEWVIRAIKKLLDLDYETDLSEEHKVILNERIEAYEKNPEQVLDWETVKKELFKK